MIKPILLATALLVNAAASAEACFGPGPCTPAPEPTGPAELCLTTLCQPVAYAWNGDFAIATSALPNGYQVFGFSGPCPSLVRSECPDILNQAFLSLKFNALQANRAQNF